MTDGDIAPIESKVRAALSKILGRPPGEISAEAHIMDDLGADSLQFLNFIAALEKEVGLTFDGSEGDHLATVNRASSYVKRRLAEAGITLEPVVPEIDMTQEQVGYSKPSLAESGALCVDLEIGMPLTGRNNLAESSLLKVIGDLRWRHIGLYSGVASKDLTDEAGERLYATFYYVEVNFPESAPMASYGENDHLWVMSTLQTYGRSTMDGFHYLVPASLPESERTMPAGPEAALAAGIPYIRTSNIFVKMLKGASWLKKSKPAQAGISAIPELENPPETGDWVKAADEHNGFCKPGANYLRFTPDNLEVDYSIVPDRDLNGVGLLYFANYPLILDIVEREVMADRAIVPFSQEQIDMRSVVRRRSAYLSNASQSDSIRVSATGWIEDLNDDSAPVRLMMNYVMHRVSDGRKMMVSTVWKTLSGVTAGDLGILPALRSAQPTLTSVT